MPPIGVLFILGLRPLLAEPKFTHGIYKKMIVRGVIDF